MNDNKNIDKNLDRLLGLGESLPVMPEDLKNQIRSRLLQMAPEPDRKKPFSFRWAIFPLAVAASLLFFLFVPWKGDLNGNISWADVQKHLDNVHTIVSNIDIITSSSGEERTVTSGKVYHKDPGLTRSEINGEHNDLDLFLNPKPQWININKRTAGRSELLTLQPDAKQAEWTTQIFRTIGPENPPILIIDAASESWEIMKKLTEDNTRLIGGRIIDGIPAVGFSFEGPAREIIRSPGVTGNAYGKIFVRREDGVPLYIEAECQTTLGQKTRLEARDILLNVPLEESLFDFYVPDGWHLKRTWIETAEYADTELAPGTRLNIGLDGKDPLISADDLIGVIKVECVTGTNTEMPGFMNVTIELEQTAAQRLLEHSKVHPMTIIVVDFNGQIKVATMLDKNDPEHLTFDLSRLGYSLSEVEENYFTKTTTIFKGEGK